MVRTTVDEDSFASVFNAHHREAVRLAYLLVSDATEAEDIVAEAFAKVFPRWRKGQVREVGPYLRRAVANQANSKLRRRYLERREAQRQLGDDRGVRRVDDGAADRDQVWQALQQLPDRQRQAVVLRYFEDLPEHETAEVLGCTVGTVKSAVSRGLNRLEQTLTAEPGEPGEPADPADPATPTSSASRMSDRTGWSDGSVRSARAQGGDA